MISGNVIAAVRNDEELVYAVNSNVSTVFLLSTNIETISAQLEIVHSAGKQLFVHIDLADGIGKDEYGLKYLKNLGVDGIISTRTNIIKTAKKIGLFTVQRFFVVDSHSLETTVESIATSKTDVVEIMPGTLTKVVKKLKEQIDTPIVVGGLVDSVQEIENALNSGAVSVSTGKKELWVVMDINGLLKGVSCACGKFHKCDIENVYVEQGATSRLTELCKNYNNVLVVGDENTLNAAGDKTLKALQGKAIEKVVFSGETVVIPNEDAIEKVNAKISGIDLIIAVGSGVMQDLCKYVSHFSKIPYMVVATAPSMDGYASDGAAMILGGMKVTVKAGLPKAIVADTDVLKNAPIDMIKAGYGDIIGKYSALNDWKLSKIVNDEYFCQFIYDTTYQMILNTLQTAKGLLKRNGDSVKALMEALVIVGIMMSFALSSRPALGSEHHLSHFFEIVGIIEDKPYFAHGIDVAYSTVVTSSIREKLVGVNFPNKQFVDDRENYVKKMENVYKSVGKSCVELQDKVGNYNKDRASIYLDNEERIKAVLKECPTAKEIEKMLALVEMDIKEFYDMYGKQKIEDAVRYAKDLKDRYTVLWMNYDIFGD